jgi:hypothetical protein
VEQCIERAREIRGQDGINPSELHRLAKEDAAAILDWYRDNASTLHSLPVMRAFSHLTVTELTASIYRHAMIECGAMEEAATGKPFDPCPICGHSFS